jgi:hypothetical protein
MRSYLRCLTIAAALGAIASLTGKANAAPVYEWEYSVDGGAFVTRALTSTTSNTDSVSLLGGTLTVAINTFSNSPGTSLGAELFNATTDVVNTSGVAHTVVVNVTETDFTAPTTPAELTASVGPVTLRLASSNAGGTASASFLGSSSVGTSAFGSQIASTNSYTASGTATKSTGSVTLANANLTNGSFVSHSTPFSMTVSESVTLGINTSGHIEIDSNFNPNVSAVPEPSSIVLAGLGALGMIGYGLRRRKASGA